MRFSLCAKSGAEYSDAAMIFISEWQGCLSLSSGLDTCTGDINTGGEIQPLPSSLLTLDHVALERMDEVLAFRGVGIAESQRPPPGPVGWR